MFLPYNTEGMSIHREPRCKIKEGIGKGATPDIDHRVFFGDICSWVCSEWEQ